MPQIIDIISDLFIAEGIDRVNSKYGKYRPWLFTIIPFASMLLLLFICPQLFETELGKTFCTVIILTIMMAGFGTTYTCPINALSGVISKDNKDRLSLVSYRSIFENIAMLIVCAITMPLLSVFGQSYKDGSGWIYLAIIFAGIAIVGGIICFFGVKERVIVERQKEKVTIKQKFKLLFGNKKFTTLMLLFAFLYVSWYLVSTLFSYFCIYNLGHSDWVAILSVVSTASCVVISCLAPTIIKTFGKHLSMILAVISILVSLIILSFANSFVSVMLYCVFKDFGQVVIYVYIASLVPTVADEIKTNNKVDQTSFVFGVSSSCQKMYQGIGTFLSTLLLSLGKYDGEALVQSDTTLNFIRYGCTIALLITVIGIAIIMLVKKKDDII